MHSCSVQSINGLSSINTFLSILQRSANELRTAGVSFSPASGAASLSLPPKIFQTVENDVGLAFATYSDASLFPVGDNMDERFSIASSVFGVIIHDVTTSSLEENMTVTLPITMVRTYVCYSHIFPHTHLSNMIVYLLLVFKYNKMGNQVLVLSDMQHGWCMH